MISWIGLGFVMFGAFGVFLGALHNRLIIKRLKQELFEEKRLLLQANDNLFEIEEVLKRKSKERDDALDLIEFLNQEEVISSLIEVTDKEVNNRFNIVDK